MFDWLKDKANEVIDDHPKLKDLKQQGMDYLNPEDKMLREAKKRENDYNNQHYFQLVMNLALGCLHQQIPSKWQRCLCTKGIRQNLEIQKAQL